MINNSWIYYAYGRDRVAELEGSNGIVYYNYDHLGSVRVVYDPTSNCSGSAVIYKLDNMSDYYAFGKTLRNFGGDAFGYQGSEKNKELGDNDYYTHFRGLDVEIGRWKGVDPVYQPGVGPYVSMGNNPVMFNDVQGNTVEDWFKNLRTGEVKEDKAVSGKKGDEVALYGSADTWQNLGKTKDEPEVGRAQLDYYSTHHTNTHLWASGRVDQDYTFDGGAVIGIAANNVIKPLVGVAYKYIASKLASKTDEIAEGFIKVRHHTSAEGLKGIKNSGQINASRAQPYGVDVEYHPFVKASQANLGQYGSGAYVEFTISKSSLSNIPGYMGGVGNAARIVTGGSPLNIKNMMPKYYGSSWFSW